MSNLFNIASHWAGMSVGILGGSFNPAHTGHLHIVEEALKYLRLDAVWLMVSPQNPLKSKDDMYSFEQRFESAQNIAKNNPKIFVSDIETKLNSCYTAETLSIIKYYCKKTNFIWLMGMDNLQQIHKWENWQHIFNLMPIAVIDRPPATLSVRNCPAKMTFNQYKIPISSSFELKNMMAPAWCILPIPLSPISATDIRKIAKEK